MNKNVNTFISEPSTYTVIFFTKIGLPLCKEKKRQATNFNQTAFRNYDLN